MATKKRTIGILSRETGVKVTTIRYYESVGLLPPPDRTPTGQRVYERAAQKRLNFIRHARDLGFTMPAIKDLIGLQETPDQTCEHVDAIASRQLSEVRHRISRLKALETELQRMIVSCAGENIAQCKVLECLDDHSQCAEDHPAPTHKRDLNAQF